VFGGTILGKVSTWWVKRWGSTIVSRHNSRDFELLLLITTPPLIAATHSSLLTTTDVLLALMALALLAWERVETRDVRR